MKFRDRRVFRLAERWLTDPELRLTEQLTFSAGLHPYSKRNQDTDKYAAYVLSRLLYTMNFYRSRINDDSRGLVITGRSARSAAALDAALAQANSVETVREALFAALLRCGFERALTNYRRDHRLSRSFEVVVTRRDCVRLIVSHALFDAAGLPKTSVMVAGIRDFCAAVLSRSGCRTPLKNTLMVMDYIRDRTSGCAAPGDTLMESYRCMLLLHFMILQLCAGNLQRLRCPDADVAENLFWLAAENYQRTRRFFQIVAHTLNRKGNAAKKGAQTGLPGLSECEGFGLYLPEYMPEPLRFCLIAYCGGGHCPGGAPGAQRRVLPWRAKSYVRAANASFVGFDLHCAYLLFRCKNNDLNACRNWASLLFRYLTCITDLKVRPVHRMI